MEIVKKYCIFAIKIKKIMLTQEQIENLGFEYESSVNSYFDDKYSRDIYVAEGLIEKEDVASLIFPIKLEYFKSTNLIKITTHYANQRLYNEYFFMGEASTPEVLQSALKSLHFTVRKRTKPSLESYYQFYSENSC